MNVALELECCFAGFISALILVLIFAKGFSSHGL